MGPGILTCVSRGMRFPTMLHFEMCVPCYENYNSVAFDMCEPWHENYNNVAF